MANPTNITPGATEGPFILAGDYVYISDSGAVTTSSSCMINSIYSAHSVGIAERNIHSNELASIRGNLRYIKDRGTVFQDQFELHTEPADPTYVAQNMQEFNEQQGIRIEGDLDLSQFHMVADPIDPNATITEAPIDERTMRPVITSVQPVTSMTGQLYGIRPLGAVLESTDPASGVNTTRLNNTADAIDPELVRTMKKEGRFPKINRAQLEILKDLQVKTVKYNGQYLPCFGCEHSTGALFPGDSEPGNDTCISCFRNQRLARRGNGDCYIAKGLKADLYQQFAEEVIPVIKKQALFEAKKRISEAEESENRIKRTMVRIAKKRA